SWCSRSCGGCVLGWWLLEGGWVAIGREPVVADLGELLARRFRFALAVPHAGIQPTFGEQRLVGTALHDRALVEHDDLIGGDDGRGPPRDDERGAVARHPAHRLLNFLLGMAAAWPGRLPAPQPRRCRAARTRSGGAWRMARGIAPRCFSPPESLRPRSPAAVS